MSTLTPAERAYLTTCATARIATASTTGVPDVATVKFSLDGDSIIISGADLVTTARFRNLMNNPRATLIIDDGVAHRVGPARGVKAHGHAWIEQRPGGAVIRVTPEAVVSWDINTD